MIYLASAYSHDEPAVRQERYEQAMTACVVLTRAGEHVHSSIVHWHPASVAYNLRGDYGFWQRYNWEMIELCANMFVLNTPDWELSTGVKDEIDHAQCCRKPIHLFTLSTGALDELWMPAERPTKISVNMKKA